MQRWRKSYLAGLACVLASAFGEICVVPPHDKSCSMLARAVAQDAPPREAKTTWQPTFAKRVLPYGASEIHRRRLLS